MGASRGWPAEGPGCVGLRLVKEYFGMSVGQTIKSWSVMETVISVTAILLILPLSLVI